MGGQGQAERSASGQGDRAFEPTILTLGASDAARVVRYSGLIERGAAQGFGENRTCNTDCCARLGAATAKDNKEPV